MLHHANHAVEYYSLSVRDCSYLEGLQGHGMFGCIAVLLQCHYSTPAHCKECYSSSMCKGQPLGGFINVQPRPVPCGRTMHIGPPLESDEQEAGTSIRCLQDSWSELCLD